MLRLAFVTVIIKYAAFIAGVDLCIINLDQTVPYVSCLFRKIVSRFIEFRLVNLINIVFVFWKYSLKL